MIGPLLIAMWLAASLPAPPVEATETAEVAMRAIVAAVQARMGAEAEVHVDTVLALSVPSGVVLDAVPVPGARLGAPMRFVLRGQSPGDASRIAPLGLATVTVRVVATHGHTARAVRRGDRLAASDLTEVRHVIATGALRPVSTAAHALDGRALRDLPAGACLTPQALALTPAVRAGAEVVAVMRTGGIEVRADLVSVDSGDVGETVRVTNPHSRRTFRARVVSRNLVEMTHD